MKRDSLRVRLIALYAAFVTAIVAMFGAAVCYIFWRTLVAQIDDELRTRAATITRSLQPVDGGTFDLILPDDTQEYFQQEPYYGIWASDHRVIDISDPAQVTGMPEVLGARLRDGRRELAVRAPAGVTVLVGRDLGGVRAAVRSLAVMVGSVGLAAAVLSVLCGWLLAGRALAPIARINRTARAMADGDLGARIPVDRTETELGQVALALNSAFDRMHGALEQLRRFTADASHELRTPAATLSAETEWALGRPRDADTYRDSLITCRTAALRIGGVIQGLLMLARADADEMPLAVVAIQVDRLVNEVVALARPIAAQRQVQISTSVPSAEVMGDPERLQEAISNLVVNAVNFNRPGGRVQIEGTIETDTLVLRVRDTGIGIASEHLPHVFERFYRVEPSRGAGQGAGLGLAITKWIVERHGGTLHGSSELGRGSEFVVALPCGRPAASQVQAATVSNGPRSTTTRS